MAMRRVSPIFLVVVAFSPDLNRTYFCDHFGLTALDLEVQVGSDVI